MNQDRDEKSKNAPSRSYENHTKDTFLCVQSHLMLGDFGDRNETQRKLCVQIDHVRDVYDDSCDGTRRPVFERWCQSFSKI